MSALRITRLHLLFFSSLQLFSTSSSSSSFFPSSIPPSPFLCFPLLFLTTSHIFRFTLSLLHLSLFFPCFYYYFLTFLVFLPKPSLNTLLPTFLCLPSLFFILPSPNLHSFCFPSLLHHSLPPPPPTPLLYTSPSSITLIPPTFSLHSSPLVHTLHPLLSSSVPVLTVPSPHLKPGPYNMHINASMGIPSPSLSLSPPPSPSPCPPSLLSAYSHSPPNPPFIILFSSVFPFSCYPPPCSFFSFSPLSFSFPPD